MNRIKEPLLLNKSEWCSWRNWPEVQLNAWAGLVTGSTGSINTIIRHVTEILRPGFGAHEIDRFL